MFIIANSENLHTLSSQKNSETILNAFENEFLASQQRVGLLNFNYSLCEYWKQNKPTVILTALVLVLREKGNDIEKQFVFLYNKDSFQVQLPAFHEDVSSPDAEVLPWFLNLATKIKVAPIDLCLPLRLQSIKIPKAWGEEIWYTGIEERGVSEIVGKRITKDDKNMRGIPLPWILSLAPNRLVGMKEKNINLLKVLAPLPDEIYGDLYYEIHEKKEEVYIVTDVDKKAHPSGVGAIKYGFSDEMFAKYKNENAFKKAFLQATEAYEQVRAQVDAKLDIEKKKNGYHPNAVVPASLLKKWQEQTISPSLWQQEATLKKTMESFCGKLSLKVGDVLSIQPLTPHSLQHGVRTIEFQTPVYERLILAFCQKVLNQDHWDTAQALSKIPLPIPAPSSATILKHTNDYTEKLVCDFSDFRVFQIIIKPKAIYLLDKITHYALIMTVIGKALVVPMRFHKKVPKDDTDISLLREEAFLLSAAFNQSYVLNCHRCEELIVVISLPNV